MRKLKEKKPPKLEPTPFVAYKQEGKYFDRLLEQGRAYPKNSRENFLICPVETKNCRYIEIRRWYPIQSQKGEIYQPGKGIEIMSPESLDWILKALPHYREWIIKPPALEKFIFPEADLFFDVLDQDTATKAIEEFIQRQREKLPKS